MTTLSLERVDVLTGTVSDLSRSAQLSMSLANLANNKDFAATVNAAKQDSFLQTVLALQYEGKKEKNFLLWLARCLKHEAFIVFTEADFVRPLLDFWRFNNFIVVNSTELATQLDVVYLEPFTADLLAIAAIAQAVPTIDQHYLSLLLQSFVERQMISTKGKHLILPRAVLFMEFVRDLWFDYGIELSIEHFLPFWLSLSEGRTAAIERVVFHLLRFNNAISSSVMLQILHVLVLVTLSIKELQTNLFKTHGEFEGFWLTSQELEKLLTHFILDENFLLLASKVNVMDFNKANHTRDNYSVRNTISGVFLHWVNSRYETVLDRLISREYAKNYFRFSVEQLVKYLPPFALICCDRFADQFDWAQNIRTVLPQLTQKEAHIFSNHPFDDQVEYTYYIWSAKVKNLGGNANLALALYQFRGNNFDDLAFWESVIRFCIANEPVLEQYFQAHANTYSNLFGYLAHKRQEEGNRFEMKGRSLRGIMQQAEEWYEQMNRHRFSYSYNPNLSWNGAAYAPYQLEKGDYVYTITQLTNNAALQAESAALHHCVSGYGSQCANRYCSIWSLRVSIDGSKMKSLVTIQIDNNHKIVQAKTSCNAQPNASHLAIIKEWAAREGIIFVQC